MVLKLDFISSSMFPLQKSKIIEFIQKTRAVPMLINISACIFQSTVIRA